MFTDSACPVAPDDTSSYVGFFSLPPENPDVTEMIPGNPSNVASSHQKHPPAKVARSLGALGAGAAVAADFTVLALVSRASVIARATIGTSAQAPQGNERTILSEGFGCMGRVLLRVIDSEIDGASRRSRSTPPQTGNGRNARTSRTGPSARIA